MMKNSFVKEVDLLPTDLKSIAEDFIVQIDEKLSQQQYDILNEEQINTSFIHVCCCSQFVQENVLRYPEMLIDLIQSGDLFSAQHRERYKEAFEIDSIDSEITLMRQLREFRRREMVRIAWRDLAGWAELDETMRDMTALAETCIQMALDFLYQQACSRRGIPTLDDGTVINIVVLGMGKLGAWELNYSSDIDLIFAYAEDGVLNDRKETTYGEFFTRICRSLVKVLDEITANGFVFRTDVRLRPFGDSGPLIMTFDGMENYYMTQAREWERYAMIKARQVAGDFNSGKQLAAMIKPFVYRRYLDYGAFEELRSLKGQITKELERKDRKENIKLGPGGIREIEFIGQAFQLIRGGQEPELQQREILKILVTLAKLELISKIDVDTLNSGYHFLRRVENHIQQYQDKQTHDLPTDPLVQKILSYSLGYDNWGLFKQALDVVRNDIHSIFDGVFSLSAQTKPKKKSDLIWNHTDDGERLAYLEEYGFEQCQELLSLLNSFKSSHAIKRLSTKGSGVLDRLMPNVIEAVRSLDNKGDTLTRIVVLFEEVAGRNVYFSLLAENPKALLQLIKLASASQWICEYLAKYPVLFDELLDARSLYEPLQKKELTQQLTDELNNIDERDTERLMNKLRLFKHSNVLRIAAADIMGIIPVTVVSDYLTYVAEVVLEQVTKIAWKILIDKHGYPSGAADRTSGFAILGLGKLGGFELGYGSDLDMVFLYRCAEGEDAHKMTTGEKPISGLQFYMRLGQKVRHILDTKMLSGRLYEVDLRLRPSGDSGLLVTQINSYQNYMENEAWTWEHQALVRGRFIAGDENLMRQYEQIRLNILAQPRDVDKLKQEVSEMRQKMRDNLANKNSELFDLKQSKGGIADIEFIVQFGILAHASQNRQLATYTDNARLLDGLASCGVLSSENAALLKQAYYQYRDYGHRQVLQGKKALASNREFIESRALVERLWDDLLG